MGQTTDQIANDIDRTRDHLKANLEELESRMKAVTDWRRHFEKRPGALLAAAMLGGVLLSTMVKKR
jgi:hypothetical protein